MSHSIQIPRAPGQPSNLTVPADLLTGHSCTCYIVKPIKVVTTFHVIGDSITYKEGDETWRRAMQAQDILRDLGYSSEVVTLHAGNGHRLIHEKETEVLMIDFTTD